MSSEHTVEDLLDELAESYVERLRQGERPSLDEYVEQHPDLADDIRVLFPTLRKVESATSAWTLPRVTAGTMPREIGDYQILRVAGRGGMGIVYEATQKTLGRRVALKVLPPQPHLDVRQVDRFLREAKSLARLDHPHILAVHDVGEENGCYYIVMPFIEGRSLDRALADVREASTGSTTSSPVPFDRIARFGLEAAEALGYAHRAGILHRDVKPSNLLIDSNDKLWVADFGLAKNDGSDDLTNTGDLVGTLRYMAPERFRGWCDPRSDVYGLGLTLYELVTLRQAFTAQDRAQLVRQITHEQPPRPSKLRRNLPPDLETIILKAIENEPSRRYQSADDLADDLRRFAARQPVRARRASPFEQFRSWCRRSPLVASLSTAVVFLLLAGGIASTVAAFHFNRLADDRSVALTEKARSLRETTRAKRETERLLDDVRGARREASEQLYEANVAKADALRWSHRLGQRVGSLEGLRQAASLVKELKKPPEEVVRLRNAAINSLMLADLSIEKTWDSDPPFQLGPLPRRYIRLEASRDVLVLDYASNRLLGRLDGRSAEPRWKKFSPDGRYLALGYRDRRWRLWDLDELRLVRDMRILGGYKSDGHFGLALDPFDFSPDGKSCAVLTPAGDVQIFAIASSKLLATIPTGSRPRRVLFSPDGRRLALAFSESVAPSIQVFDVTTRKPGRQFRVASGGWIASYAWSPDGRQIACGLNANKYGDITIWDAATGRRRMTLEGHRNSVRFLSFTPDGRRLISASWDGTTRVWDLALGTEELRVSGGSRYVSRDGTRIGLMHSNSRLSVARLVVSREVQLIAGQVEFAGSDGNIVAVQSPREVRLFNRRTSKILLRIPADFPVQLRYNHASSSLFVEDRNGVWRCPIIFDAATGQYRAGKKSVLAKQSRDVGRNWFVTSRDGRRFAWCDGRVVRMVDLASGKTVARLPHPGVSYLSFHPDGERIATGAYLWPEIRVWDCRSGKLVTRLWQEKPKLKGFVKFSPDGRWLVAHSADQYRFWETDSWSLRHVVRNPEGAGREGRIAFTPDGRRVALSTQINRVDLYDLRDFSQLASFEHHQSRDIQRISFSPDGQSMISQTRRGEADIWNLGAVRQVLRSMQLDW